MIAADIMRTSFATIGPEAPLSGAIRLLLETNQRGLPVLDDAGSLVGIISEGDFLHRRELGVKPPGAFWLEFMLGREEGKHVRERMKGHRVDAVMSRNPICVEENAAVDKIVAELDDNQISQVLVIRDRKVVGVVGRMQLLVALEQRLRQSEISVAADGTAEVIAPLPSHPAIV